MKIDLWGAQLQLGVWVDAYLSKGKNWPEDCRERQSWREFLWQEAVSHVAFLFSLGKPPVSTTPEELKATIPVSREEDRL